jgi:hypothetical protein
VVGWLPAECLLLRRTALDSVDGFDPGYVDALDDVDLGARLGGGRLALPARARGHRHDPPVGARAVGTPGDRPTTLRARPEPRGGAGAADARRSRAAQLTTNFSEDSLLDDVEAVVLVGREGHAGCGR